MSFENFMSGFARNLRLPQAQPDQPDRYMQEIMAASLGNKRIAMEQAWRNEQIRMQREEAEKAQYVGHIKNIVAKWNEAKKKSEKEAVKKEYRLGMKMLGLKYYKPAIAENEIFTEKPQTKNGGIDLMGLLKIMQKEIGDTQTGGENRGARTLTDPFIDTVKDIVAPSDWEAEREKTRDVYRKIFGGK